MLNVYLQYSPITLSEGMRYVDPQGYKEVLLDSGYQQQPLS